MFRKWIGKIHLASFVGIIVAAVIVAVYYNLIDPEHEGAVELWGILLLSIPFGILCISTILIKCRNIDFEESFGHQKIPKGIMNILTALLAIPLFPILLIMGIVAAALAALSTPGRKDFKRLIGKGFAYRHKNKKYTLQKENIRIEISGDLEEYLISFDSGETFKKVEESHLGTAYDREELKFRLHEYLHAHPVDRQRGDAISPLAYYVAFLDTYLS